MVSESTWLMSWPRLDVNLYYLPGEKTNSTGLNKHVYVCIEVTKHAYLPVTKHASI